MVPDARRLQTLTWIVLVVGTQGFVVHPPPCAATRGAGVERSSASSPAVGRAYPSRTMRRTRATLAASWRSGGLGRRSDAALFSAQQSVDEGVMLPPAENADEFAPFLSDSIRQHLDEEWLPQECHKGIGDEVARLYRAAVERGDADMNTLVLDVGSEMEKFDMGDAFVGPWDIANLVSDFLMQKMGAETSGCTTKVPTAVATSPSAFRMTSAMVRQMQTDLTSDFARYRFLVDFMEGDTKWEEANTVMAVYQGYRPEDEIDSGGGAALGVRQGWARAFPGPSPPDLCTAEGLVEALEADFPEDPDMLDGLEVIVETVYGGEAKRMDGGDPEKGIPPNPVYSRRATVCKWLYLMGFLQDDIKRAPDDPTQLAELISGRARLKNKS